MMQKPLLKILLKNDVHGERITHTYQRQQQRPAKSHFLAYANGIHHVIRKFSKLLVVIVVILLLSLLLQSNRIASFLNTTEGVIQSNLIPYRSNDDYDYEASARRPTRPFRCIPSIQRRYSVCVTCPNSDQWTGNEGRDSLLLMDMEGRLGNLLFQYASLVGIAQQTKKIPVLINTVGLQQTFPNISICSLRRVSTVNPVSRLFLSKCIDADHCRFAQSNIDCASSSVNVEMKGYFQSYRYFESRRGELLNELSFGEGIRELAESQVKAARIKAERYYELRDVPSRPKKRLKAKKTPKNNNAEAATAGVRLVGVHVRRGDIATEQYLIDFGYLTAPPTYLARAASYFVSRYERVYFLVCSDDYSWTRGVWPAEFVERTEFCDESNGAEVDMAVLSRCDDSLITVGSFSFWAAYLRETIQLKESGSLAEAKSGSIQTREASVNFSSIAQSQSQLKRTSKKWKARRQDEAKTTGDVSGYGKRVGETVYYAKPYREGTMLASLFTLGDYYPSTWRAME